MQIINNFLDITDYRDLLKELVDAKRDQFGMRITYARMAGEAKIQKTYLSKALSGGAHLNSDQTYMCGKYLGLSEVENDYLLLLHQQTRASLKPFRQSLESKLQTMRTHLKKIESNLDLNVSGTSSLVLERYYLDPNVQLIHMFLHISAYAENPEILVQTLGIKDARLVQILELLQTLGLVKFQDGRYEILKSFLHLPEDSSLIRAVRSSARINALRHITEPDADDFVFSVVFSADENTRHQIRQKLMAVLREMENEVRGAESREIFQLNLDFIKWS